MTDEEDIKRMAEIVYEMYRRHDVQLTMHPRPGLNGDLQIFLSLAPREGVRDWGTGIGYLEAGEDKFVVTGDDAAQTECFELGSLLAEYGYYCGRA